LPTISDFAGLAPIIRGSLGPRGRGEARRLARQCAASCDAVFALAITQKENVAMVGDPSNNQPNELVHQVVDACQNVIKNAVAQPKTAIHLAHKLAGSLSTLQLVQSEVAKSKAGAVTIIQHAEELTRGARTDVLKHASNPTNALDAVELGLHLCFGDWGGIHQIEPIDTGAMVELANAIAARGGRRLSYVHMPVPIARNDSAYFEPLRRLALGAHTEVYLGLVHLKDGVEGARQRVSAAREHLSDFGVAAECGLGRAKTSATVTDILALHAAVCDAVSVR
jgi:hypothetical protein